MDAQKSERLTELMVKLQGEITDDERVELLSIMLDDDAMRVEARELCYRWLNDNSEDTRVRLMLARSFYLEGYAEFCTRELKALAHYSSSPSVARLAELIGQGAPAYVALEREAEGTTDRVVAEVDIDTEFVDILEDLDSEKTNEG
jgi:hypothetical protein